MDGRVATRPDPSRGPESAPASSDPDGGVAALAALVATLGSFADEAGAQLWSLDRDTPTLVGRIGACADPRLDDDRSFASAVARRGRTTIGTGPDREDDGASVAAGGAGPVPFRLGGVIEAGGATRIVCLSGRLRPDAGISAGDAEAIVTLAQACLGSWRETMREGASAGDDDRPWGGLEAAWDGISDDILAFDRSSGLSVCNRNAAHLMALAADHANPDPAPRDGEARSSRGPSDAEIATPGLPSSAWPGHETETRTADGRILAVRVASEGDRRIVVARDVTAEHRRDDELGSHETMVRWQFHIGAIANEARSLKEALENFLAFACREMKYEFGRVSRLVPGSGSDLVPTGIVYGDPAAIRDATARSGGSGRPGDLARRALRSSVAVFETDAEPGGPDAPWVSTDGRPLTFGWACAYQVGDEILVFERYGSDPVRPRLAHPSLVSHLEAQLSRVAERERIDRLKAKFVDSISTDMNMPLATIRGILDAPDLDRLAAASDEVRDMVAIARSNAERLGQVIEDTLTVHRLDRTSARPVPVRTDIGSLVKQCVLRFTCPQAISMRLGPAGASVMTDVRSVEQIMAHLLSNAAKFSSPEQVITVVVEAGPDRVRVSVADKGPGIPESFYGQIFRDFTQADQSDTRRSAGTGLGLAVAKRLAGRMDAVLDFDPHVETGATFFLELPRAD